ncbi:palmdelphin isoform X4 [Salvelinus fontinalis]|uniref:palmdelphin isoform X4 n=1 Tax=Salvelinus fontinalis TaxID=8038 RepID=UPI0024853194|nr:palmdelphin isoform X4 [Salvelinus fontinalis]
MEEADLLKERLQAITEKRRVQDDIAKKRRQIEEEKLKLQCLKKKALREQWLMDGLSPQSEEDQEATKLQAQGDQEQTLLLQSNIDRMETEIEALETQELQISANEEVILKRLKEVERTAEDIIKELNAEYQADPIQYVYAPIPNVTDFQMQRSITPTSRPLRKKKNPQEGLDGEEPKQAMFAMEISVEKDMRTGESQVVSMTTLTPEEFQQKGVKVYDDGKKSVYALRSEGQVTRNGVGLGELSNIEVEALLRQAGDAEVPTEVQYHRPVYAAPYTSRPSTPAWKPEQGHVSPSPGEPNGHRTSITTPHPQASPFQMLPEALPRDGAQSREEVASSAPSHIPNILADKHLVQPQSPPHQCFQTCQILTNGSSGIGPHPDKNRPAIIAVLSSGESRTPIPLIENTVTDWDRQSPIYPNCRQSPFYPSSRQSPFYTSDSGESSFNIMNTLPPDLDSEPVTMIFMGYQNAAEEEDEENIQAELVVIGNGDDDEEDDNNVPSYHPEGYRSKIFQPTARCNNNTDYTADSTNSESLLHRPTFTHKPGKRSSDPDQQPLAIEVPMSAGIKTGKNNYCCLGGWGSSIPLIKC